MPRARPPPDDADEDDVAGEEEPVPHLPRSRSSRTTRHSLRPWRTGESPDDDRADAGPKSGEDEDRAWRNRPKRPVFYRARDSPYFEPLLALCAVVVLLAGLWGYTMNWPPIYVVESSSMQHGDADQVGLLNAGDLVLAKKVSAPGGVTTYYEGLVSSFSTYGAYGDVILYYPDGVTGGTPIIHRAILWIVYNPNGTYSIPDLVGLPCGSASDALYRVQTSTGCLDSSTEGVAGTLNLYDVGWASVNVTIALSDGGAHSGFLTMGDNNFGDGVGFPDQPSLSEYVEPGWVVGVARGMIPWFGGLKLLLTGDASYVPPQSWEFMAITLVAVVLAAFGIHYALRSAGIQDPRRRREAEGRGGDAGTGPTETSEGPLKAWDVDQDEEGRSRHGRARPRKATRTRESTPSGSRGRPAPRTHRDAQDSGTRGQREEDD